MTFNGTPVKSPYLSPKDQDYKDGESRNLQKISQKQKKVRRHNTNTSMSNIKSSYLIGGESIKLQQTNIYDTKDAIESVVTKSISNSKSLNRSNEVLGPDFNLINNDVTT
jgi:hypothetical protein